MFSDDSINILPNFNGIAIHDGWKSYNSYTECTHALCNAHILRELNGVTETQKQRWAKVLKKLFIIMKKAIENSQEVYLKPELISKFENRYDKIVQFGFKEDYEKNFKLYNKKEVKNSVPRQLLNRLSGFKNQILAFIHDFNIPFDNNLAERDIRMTKVKQKISGTFRSFEGAKYFARSRGYISTIRKNNLNAFECLKSLFTLSPLDPTLI